MTRFRYGEIYLVNFDPGIGHEYQKRRPAVVIQSDFQLTQSSFVAIIPLTSQVAKSHRDDIPVKKSSRNRLYLDSLLKVHFITSFDRQRFIKHTGSMEDVVMERIKEYLKRHFLI